MKIMGDQPRPLTINCNSTSKRAEATLYCCHHPTSIFLLCLKIGFLEGFWGFGVGEKTKFQQNEVQRLR